MAPNTSQRRRRERTAAQRDPCAAARIPHHPPRIGRFLRSVAATFLLFACAAGSLNAQTVSVGGRLGLAGGAVVFEDEEANDMQQPVAGLQVGGVAVFRSQSTFSVHTELWYIQKGWTETPDGGSRRLSYLELPILLTLSAPWRTAPQLIVGVSGSVELGCSVGGTSGNSVSCDDPRVTWDRSTVQFGTWLGLGARRRFGSGTAALQLLGNLNLTNVSSEALPRGYSRLLTLALAASYVIPLGGGGQ